MLLVPVSVRPNRLFMSGTGELHWVPGIKLPSASRISRSASLPAALSPIIAEDGLEGPGVEINDAGELLPEAEDLGSEAPLAPIAGDGMEGPLVDMKDAGELLPGTRQRVCHE